MHPRLGFATIEASREHSLDRGARDYLVEIASVERQRNPGRPLLRLAVGRRPRQHHLDYPLYSHCCIACFPLAHSSSAAPQAGHHLHNPQGAAIVAGQHFR